MGAGGWVRGRGSGWGEGGCEPSIEGIVKRALKYFTCTIKNKGDGGGRGLYEPTNPLRLFKMK